MRASSLGRAALLHPPAPASIPNISSSTLLTHLTTPSPSSFPSSSSSSETFIRPLLLPGLTSDWPCIREWSYENAFGGLSSDLAVRDGRVMVEVELGRAWRGYLDPGWRRVEMPFALFLDAFMLDRIPSTTPEGRAASASTSAFCAQQDLFEKIPSLKGLIPHHPHAHESGPNAQFWRRNLWIGKKTFSPVHRDPYVNLYTQVYGQKRVHLFSPSQACNLYLSTHPRHLNTSTIPVPPPSLPPDPLSEISPEHTHQSTDTPTPEIFRSYPKFLSAMRHEETRSAVLNPGETLLIPEGWWHSFESMAVDGRGEISVNSWFR